MRRKQITVTNNLVSNNVGNIAVEWKGMKKRLLHFKKKFVPALSGAVMGVMLMSTTCFAAGDTSAVPQPLENLKTLVIAVIGAVGVIILTKNVMEFAQAYQQQDSSTMNSALKGVVAGVIMAGISTVLTFLGFQKGVDWMEKRYNIIYADPPWKYDRQKGEGVAADIYQTLSLAEIESIPVNEIAADDAVLFLWVTFPGKEVAR